MDINKYFKNHKLKLKRLDFCISKNDIIYYLNSKDYSCFSDKLYRKKIIDYINQNNKYRHYDYNIYYIYLFDSLLEVKKEENSICNSDNEYSVGIVFVDDFFADEFVSESKEKIIKIIEEKEENKYLPLIIVDQLTRKSYYLNNKIIGYKNLSSLYHGINIINKARKLKIRRGKKDENKRK